MAISALNATAVMGREVQKTSTTRVVPAVQCSQSTHRSRVVYDSVHGKAYKGVEAYLHYQESPQKEAEQAALSEMFGIDLYV